MKKAHRPLVMGKKGMVAAGHPLASLVGMKVLMEGWNAIDASILHMQTGKEP